MNYGSETKTYRRECRQARRPAHPPSVWTPNYWQPPAVLCWVAVSLNSKRNQTNCIRSDPQKPSSSIYIIQTFFSCPLSSTSHNNLRDHEQTKMAFELSKNQPSSPLSDQENSADTKTSVTSQLYLKKSSSTPSPSSSAREHNSQALDRDVVLRRIRHHKRMEKARRNLRAVFGVPPPLAADADDMSVYEHKLLQMGDVFCSP